MGGCCARRCGGSSTKGYLMRKFPKDDTLREKWVKNVALGEKWSPSKGHSLCSLHFAVEHWKDGTIKKGAIPTVFCECENLAMGKTSYDEHSYVCTSKSSYSDHEYTGKGSRKILRKNEHYSECPLSKGPRVYTGCGNDENTDTIVRSGVCKRRPLAQIQSNNCVNEVVASNENLETVTSVIQEVNNNHGEAVFSSCFTSTPVKPSSIPFSLRLQANESEILSESQSCISSNDVIIPTVEEEISTPPVECESPVSQDVVASNIMKNTLLSILKLSLNEKDAAIRKLVVENFRLKNSNIVLRKSNNALRHKVKRLQNSHVSANENLLKIIPSDQILAIGRKSNRGVKWTPASIKMGLKDWFHCGSSGYKKHSWPHPSLRVLQRSIQHITFNPGVLMEVFDCLQVKIESLPATDKVCVLCFDEMEIVESLDWDPSTKGYIGNCTLPGQSGLASKGLAFVLGGVASRWKQLVAYHLTGKKSAPAAVKDVILKIVKLCDKIGLHLICLISDMGNRNVWAELGISSVKDLIVYHIPHPTRLGEPLFVMPDPVHIFKNLVHMFLVHKKFTLPQDIADAQGLPGTDALKSDLDKVVEYQESSSLKMAPKLSAEILDETNYHFSKMNVNISRSIVNWPSSVALNQLADTLNIPSMKVTAWLFDFLDQWFRLVTGRCKKTALHPKHPAVYERHLYILRLAINIFERIIIPGGWKPVQTGMIMVSSVLLDMQHMLLFKIEFRFVMFGRFNQDFVENTFSSVREGRPTPTSVQLKQRLKHMTICQCLKAPRKTNYSVDERVNLASDVLLQKKDSKPQPSEQENYDEFLQIQSQPVVIGNEELSVLYRTAGYIVHSIRINERFCSTCIDCLRHKGCEPHPQSAFTKAMNFTNDAQVEVSEDVFQMAVSAEKVIHEFFPRIQKRPNAQQFIMTRVKDFIVCGNEPVCHPSIFKRFMERWVSMRLKQKRKEFTQAYRCSRKKKGGRKSSKYGDSALSSKSMGSRMLAERLKI